MATLKLGVLVLKTLAKPVSSTIKQRAKTHPRFREVTVALAQSFHRAETRLRARFFDVKHTVTIQPLTEAKALELGANAIGEAFIFAVGGGLILFEQYRSKRKTTNRNANIDEQLDSLQKDNDDVRRLIQDMAQRQQRLETMLDTRLSRIEREVELVEREVVQVETKLDPASGAAGGERRRTSEFNQTQHRQRQLLQPQSQQQQQQQQVDGLPPSSPQGGISSAFSALSTSLSHAGRRLIRLWPSSWSASSSATSTPVASTEFQGLSASSLQSSTSSRHNGPPSPPPTPS